MSLSAISSALLFVVVIPGVDPGSRYKVVFLYKQTGLRIHVRNDGFKDNGPVSQRFPTTWLGDDTLFITTGNANDKSSCG